MQVGDKGDLPGSRVIVCPELRGLVDLLLLSEV